MQQIDKNYVEGNLTTAILTNEPVIKNACLYRIGVYLGLINWRNHHLTEYQEEVIFRTAYDLLD